MSFGNVPQKTFPTPEYSTDSFPSQKAPKTVQHDWHGLTSDLVGSCFSGESIFISVSFSACSVKGFWCMQIKSNDHIKCITFDAYQEVKTSQKIMHHQKKKKSNMSLLYAERYQKRSSHEAKTASNAWLVLTEPKSYYLLLVLIATAKP